MEVKQKELLWITRSPIAHVHLHCTGPDSKIPHLAPKVKDGVTPKHEIHDRLTGLRGGGAQLHQLWKDFMFSRNSQANFNRTLDFKYIRMWLSVYNMIDIYIEIYEQ